MVMVAFLLDVQLVPVRHARRLGNDRPAITVMKIADSFRNMAQLQIMWKPSRPLRGELCDLVTRSIAFGTLTSLRKRSSAKECVLVQCGAQVRIQELVGSARATSSSWCICLLNFPILPPGVKGGFFFAFFFIT